MSLAYLCTVVMNKKSSNQIFAPPTVTESSSEPLNKKPKKSADAVPRSVPWDNWWAKIIRLCLILAVMGGVCLLLLYHTLLVTLFDALFATLPCLVVLRTWFDVFYCLIA